jgi:subtilisin family serine protease
MRESEHPITQLHILNDRYQKGVIIIPRTDDGSSNHTFSRAAVERAQLHSTLALHMPRVQLASTLRYIGLEDLERLQQAKTAISERGAFFQLDNLGVAAAFYDSDQVLIDAINELGEEYELLQNFSLSLPSPVGPGSMPSSSLGLTSEAVSEWPESSGIKAAHEQMIRGAGVLIGVLDSGVDADHPEFSHSRITFRYIGLRPSAPYMPPRDVRGFDTDGHGTHVSGILVGRNVGIVPEATLYSAAVIESETVRTSMMRLVFGLDWLLDRFRQPENKFKPAVINMSLGFPHLSPGIPAGEWNQRVWALRRLVQVLTHANVFSVAAIGNEGPGRCVIPGAFDEVCSVGAVDFSGTVANFSGSAPQKDDCRSNPDIYGYGVEVYAPVERMCDGTPVYQRLSGTSMAAPYVAGIAALYRCRYPKMSVDETYRRLMDNAGTVLKPDPNCANAGLARFVPV